MKEAMEILKKFHQNGKEAYLVGGAPRNHYLRLPIDDYDFCTNAKPEEVKELFPDADMRFSHYGNVRIGNYEVTTYRKELSYEKHRKPTKIEYVSTLEEDLQRRDFIINTLCMNENGEYVDLLGARKDLDDKIIRTVGDSRKKLEEDALRILRAIRFACTLHFELEKSLEEAILEKKYLLKEISYERKKEELDQIFSTEQGISLLLKYHLEGDLELEKLPQVTGTTKEEIWKQLDVFALYPFSKKEKERFK